jgi:cell division protein FtsB
MSERLKVAEKELARISAENARLVAENSLLRARLSSRAAVDHKS